MHAFKVSTPADAAEPGSDDLVPEARVNAQRAARRRAAVRRRRKRRWLIAFLVLVVVLSPALYSYTTTMLQPLSLPLGVRSVEWLRANHGNWLVDEVEHIYHGWWKAPTKGWAAT